MRKHDNAFLKDVVERVLRTDAKSRDDDAYLYGEVLNVLCPKVLTESLQTFLSKVSSIDDIPSIECVGRVRRKLQEQYTELSSSDKCKRRRASLEREYHVYYAN